MTDRTRDELLAALAPIRVPQGPQPVRFIYATTDPGATVEDLLSIRKVRYAQVQKIGGGSYFQACAVTQPSDETVTPALGGTFEISLN